MRRDPCVLIGICVLFAAPAAMSQSERPAESPSPQMTVPAAQQPPQQRQRTQRPPEQAASQPEAAQGKAAQHPPVAEEKSSVTHHSARIGGQEIKYIATAATYNIKADDGTPKATMFYVAYTKDGVSDMAKRPISFVYNGGPGSASLFTHMGMGPKRVVLTPDGHGMPAPYAVVVNEDSFLDATDLVFIDAIFWFSLMPSRRDSAGPRQEKLPINSTGSSRTRTGSRISSISTSHAMNAGL